MEIDGSVGTERTRRTAMRDSSQPKGRQVNDDDLAVVKAYTASVPIRRDMLIEALHEIQDKEGCLHANHLGALAEIYKISLAEVFEVASFYHHFDVVKNEDEKPAPVTVRVCDSVSCMMAGSSQLIRDLKLTLDKSKYRISAVPCIGRCGAAPAANIGRFSLDNADVKRITEHLNSKPQFSLPDYEGLDRYQKNGGYEYLKSCITGGKDRDEVIAVMSDSGLRGMGGAGFPAGRKWSIVKNYPGPRLMTINGDEGEVGTYKDRFWLESSPHRMLEGALIAAWAVGSERIYLYMRDEYPQVLEILRREIAALGSLGLSSHAPIELRRGAGAYICGEESAMIESIEGKRGLPRQRPPYIAEVGLFGRPTLNHNVETLNWVPDILKNGAKWFAQKGVGDHLGLRSYSVSGRVKRPGVKVAPAGISVHSLINEYCGGMENGHVFKGFLPGGASGGIFPARMAELALDFGTFEKFGGFIGSHAVIIFSEKDSVKDIALNLARFFQHESCGQCTPCRAGTEKMVSLLEKRKLNTRLLADLKKVMGDSSICGLGQAASNPVKHLIEHFPKDFEVIS